MTQLPLFDDLPEPLESVHVVAEIRDGAQSAAQRRQFVLSRADWERVCLILSYFHRSPLHAE